MANTYLTDPLSWDEIRVRFPNQNVVLRNHIGRAHAFSSARVVLGATSQTPVLPGRFSAGHLVYDTSDEFPDPVVSTTLGLFITRVDPEPFVG